MAPQDRWSFVTSSITLKCGPFCQEYLVFQDRWSLKTDSTVHHTTNLQAIMYTAPCINAKCYLLLHVFNIGYHACLICIYHVYSRISSTDMNQLNPQHRLSTVLPHTSTWSEWSPRRTNIAPGNKMSVLNMLNKPKHNSKQTLTNFLLRCQGKAILCLIHGPGSSS